LLDEPYTATPLYGVRRMTAWLWGLGYAVNSTHVRRLLRQMGLAALDAKPRLSQPAEGQVIYPYLLRGVTVTRLNQVWSTDITDIRLQASLVYLVAVIDWFSRDVLSWALSNTMDGALCLEALEQALAREQPKIFNTDQGAQFTSQAFTARRQQEGIQISLDGRGRALDHVFVERVWRSVTDEEVYLRDDHTVWDVRHGFARYFAFYNGERLHQALGYRTPARCTGDPGKASRTGEGKRSKGRPPNRTYFARKMVLTMGSTSVIEKCTAPQIVATTIWLSNQGQNK
jgi:putative transposase